MIMKLLTGKALPWVASGLAVLLFILLAAVYALHSRNAALSKELGGLEEKNVQLLGSIKRQSESYQALASEMKRRGKVIAKAQQSRQESERQVHEKIEALRTALADNECAGRTHPSAITDILRSGSGDRVQN